VLVRNPTLTHLVDGDQRTVELRVLARHGKSITVAGPPTGNVAPPGPYMLFVNETTDKGLVPSVSRQVVLGPNGITQKR
jgi:galactose oxidase-like protein